MTVTLAGGGISLDVDIFAEEFMDVVIPVIGVLEVVPRAYA